MRPRLPGWQSNVINCCEASGGGRTALGDRRTVDLPGVDAPRTSVRSGRADFRAYLLDQTNWSTNLLAIARPAVPKPSANRARVELTS